MQESYGQFMRRSSARDGSLSIDSNSALSSWVVTQTTLPHRLDASPAGYAWRVGLHQSPPSLRQTRATLEEMRLIE